MSSKDQLKNFEAKVEKFTLADTYIMSWLVFDEACYYNFIDSER